MMPKYTVIISEEHLYSETYAVEAESKEEAKQKALSHEGKHMKEETEYKGVSFSQVEEVIEDE